MSRIAFALFAAIAGLGLTIAVELNQAERAPPPPLADNPAPRAARAAAPPPEDRTAALVATIEARPLFSPTRRPAAEAEARATAEQPLPRLTGIMVTPTERRVIFEGTDKPLVLQEGDRLGQFRVSSIAVGQVTVLGPGGPITLHPAFSSEPARAAAAPPAPAATPSILGMLQKGQSAPAALPAPPTLQQLLDRQQRAQAQAPRG